MKIEIKNNETTLPFGNINHIVDVGERFNKERQDSPDYRVVTAIRPLISNALFNLTGPDSWDSLNSYELRLSQLTNINNIINITKL